VIEKSLDPDRQWHLRVYAQLCVEHLMGIDMDIAESLAGQIKKYELGLQRLESDMDASPDSAPEGFDAKVTEMIAEGKTPVIEAACQEVCDIPTFSDKKKTKKKKKTSKKKKKKSKDKEL